MGKTAFIFPGQGAQYSGMGKYLYDNYPEAQGVYNEASALSGIPLGKLGLDCDESELSLTVNSQPAMFVSSTAAASVLRSRGIAPDVCAGFSLGECAALCCAGVFDFEQGVRLIVSRAKAMHNAALSANGAMFAILGLAAEVVEEICAQFKSTVFPVNYNCPGQLVIAGAEPDISAAAEKCLESKAMKAVRLNVPAAFHSPYMESAAQAFKAEISNMSFSAPSCDFYSNLTGEMPGGFTDVPSYMASCMTSPVKWETQVRNMIRDGVDTFIEVGAGKVLSALVRKTDRSVKAFCTDSEKDMSTVLAAFD